MHNEQCPFRFIRCACQQVYRLSDIADHSLKCDLVTEKCLKCEAQVKYSQRAEHDCINTYKKLLKDEK